MSGAAAHDRVFDPGLQPERTLLAWRRTVLALAAAALVALRLLPPVLGPWSISLAVAALATTVAVAIAAERSYRRTHVALTAGDDPGPARALPGRGGLIAATAAVGALAGLVALATGVVLIVGAVS